MTISRRRTSAGCSSRRRAIRRAARRSCSHAPADEEQAKFIGDQAGGRVFLFLQTDDFRRDYQRLLDKGVRIEREPLEAD